MLVAQLLAPPWATILGIWSCLLRWIFVQTVQGGVHPQEYFASPQKFFPPHPKKIAHPPET
jgi:hypothetical protein